MIRSLFVSMQELNKGARRPAGCRGLDAEEDRRARRRPDGRRHRLCVGAGRPRGGADRPRSGGRRQGQGLFAKAARRPDQEGPRQAGGCRRAARAHHADAGLRRAQGRRSRHRSRVRGPQGEGRGDREGAGRDRRQGGVRLQHLDLADHFAGRAVEGPDEFHRRAFLLAGRQDDAGRDHHGREDRRSGARGRARLRARDPQDADRGERCARLLHLARGRHLHPRRPPDADRRRAGRDDRECRQAWPACRSARCRSTTKSRSISRGRF